MSWRKLQGPCLHSDAREGRWIGHCERWKEAMQQLGAARLPFQSSNCQVNCDRVKMEDIYFGQQCDVQAKLL